MTDNIVRMLALHRCEPWTKALFKDGTNSAACILEDVTMQDHMAYSLSAAAFHPRQHFRLQDDDHELTLPKVCRLRPEKGSFPCGLGHSIAEYFFVASDYPVR